ncbi:CHC2-type zinc finger protein [Gemmobacter caeni]|uniref:CHC2-type zinc finger protein n=2 Tax=Gemmobacter caeni TaxID=589035 RepID=A0A2T6AP74_9RHOB|nr:CHC2-type zinc finger protein [Gemmobacter caeni]TWI93768.1 CHC2-type zinc finger protein [Gemmobacter caeni]
MDMAEVANRLAIQGLQRAGREMIGPCPRCGGTDRFGINTQKRVFQCRRCGGKGGNVDLVMFVMGTSFPAALEWLCGSVEGVSPEERRQRERQAAENKARNDAKAAAAREQARREAREIWEQGQPAQDSPVHDYLALRGIPRARFPRLPVCLRFHPSLGYMVQVDRKWVEAHRGPAMLAAIQGPDGRFIGVHRTWFDTSRPKGKPEILHPVSGDRLKVKKSLGSVKGGSLRLTPPGRVLIMGEGIETTLTALLADEPPGASYWAGVSLGNMAGQRQLGQGMKYAGLPDLGDTEAFVPPAGVERLIFVQDGDSEPRLTRAQLLSGIRRAMALRPGLRGQVVPCPAGVDLNDVLMEGPKVSGPVP